MGKIIRLEEGSNYMMTKGAILIDKAQLEIVKDILKEKGIPHEGFNTPLEAFYSEEAKWRIHTQYDVSSLSIEEQDTIAKDIADELLDSTVLDNDFIDTITRNHIDTFEDEGVGQQLVKDLARFKPQLTTSAEIANDHINNRDLSNDGIVALRAYRDDNH